MKRLRSTAERPSGGRTPRLGVFLLSAAVLTSACDSSSDKSSGNFFGRGDALSETLAGVRALRSEERFLDAVNTLKSAEGEFRGEDLRTVSRLKARCYLDANVALRAEAGVQELLARDANDFASQILLGEAQRQLHRFDSAEATLREALQKRPGDLEAELSLARTLYRLGKGEESVRLFEHFLEKAITEEGDYGPGRPIRELRLEYGRALAQAGRLKESADVFARLLEERPLESALYRELASTQFRLRRREAGIFLKKIYDAVSQRDYQKQIERRLLDSGQVVFGLGQRAFNHYNVDLHSLAATAESPSEPLFEEGLCLGRDRWSDFGGREVFQLIGLEPMWVLMGDQARMSS